jgi:hypothetical protein
MVPSNETLKTIGIHVMWEKINILYDIYTEKFRIKSKSSYCTMTAHCNCMTITKQIAKCYPTK